MPRVRRGKLGAAPLAGLQKQRPRKQKVRRLARTLARSGPNPTWSVTAPNPAAVYACASLEANDRDPEHRLHADG